MDDLHPRAEDPLARVLFLIVRDHLPVGIVEHAIERARAYQKSVPPEAAGLMACELAEKIHALSGDRVLVD